MPTEILFLNHISDVSGAEAVLLNIVERLDRKDFNPVLACPASSDLVSRATNLGIPVLDLPFRTLGRTVNPLKLGVFFYIFVSITLKLRRILVSRQISLVHANSFICCLYSAVACRLARVPIVWYMHNILNLRLYNKFFARIAGLAATSVVATSETMRHNLTALGVDASKIVVNCCGVDLNTFAPSENAGRGIRRELEIDNDCFTVGIVGQLAPWKGHRTFIEAAQLVAREAPSVKFLIVGTSLTGDEDYRDELMQLVSESSLNESVVFTGSRTDVPAVMAALDVLVNASWLEPFGLVILEAMAVGKPVIGTKAGGVVEMIEDGVNGFLIPPKSPRELANAILRLVSDPVLARELGRHARETVEAKYSLGRNIERAAEIYNAVMDRRYGPNRGS